MAQINFTSTYRIPITQAGVNTAKKNALRDFASQYPNSIVPKGNDGSVRVSVDASEDENFVQGLKLIGYKIYQIFDAHNVPQNKLDAYVKRNLAERNYQQVGKNMNKMSADMRAKQRFEQEKKEYKVSKKIQKQQLIEYEETARRERIRKTPEFQRIKKQYGAEFAEVVYFGREK